MKKLIFLIITFTALGYLAFRALQGFKEAIIDTDWDDYEWISEE